MFERFLPNCRAWQLFNDTAAGSVRGGPAPLIVPPGPTPDARAPPAVIDALRAVHNRGGRLVSVCTGAFLLAQTGLLDGRRATTHWMYADALAGCFPQVNVDPGVLFVDEDNGDFPPPGP